MFVTKFWSIEMSWNNALFINTWKNSVFLDIFVMVPNCGRKKNVGFIYIFALSSVIMSMVWYGMGPKLI